MIRHLKIICLLQNGSEIEVNTSIGYINNFNEDAVIDGENSKGVVGTLDKIYEYYAKGKTISIFAYYDGEAGFENKHEMPHPIENDIFFGNIYMIAHVKNIPLDFSMTEYETFKKVFLGENADIDSENSWSLAESISSDNSIHEFVVDDFDEKGGSSSEDDEELVESDSDSDVDY